MHAATIESIGINTGIMTYGQSGLLVGQQGRCFTPIKVKSPSAVTDRVFPEVWRGKDGQVKVELKPARPGRDDRLLALVCGNTVDLGEGKPIPMVASLREVKNGCAGLAYGQTGIGEEYLLVLEPGKVVRVQDPLTLRWQKYRWDGKRIERLTGQQHRHQPVAQPRQQAAA